MYFQPKQEDILAQNDKNIQELEIRLEVLSREVENFFDDLQFTPEQVYAFYHNRSNFTQKEWEAIQNERKNLEKKLELKLQQICDPRRIKKAQDDRKIPHYAIFVR